MSVRRMEQSLLIDFPTLGLSFIHRKLNNLAACDMYACDKLENFFEVAPEARTALDALRS